MPKRGRREFEYLCIDPWAASGGRVDNSVLSFTDRCGTSISVRLQLYDRPYASSGMSSATGKAVVPTALPSL
jgi:hypothetical protein